MDFSVIFLLILFCVGICCGSFVGVVVMRWADIKSMFSTRSRCDSCHHTLAPLDLVPIFSYLLLDGKCRYCKRKIPAVNVVYEIVCGLVFVVVGLFYPTVPLLGFVLILAISVVLLCLFFIDYFYGILPDVLLLILFVFVTFYIAPLGWEGIITQLLIGVGIFVVFLIVYLLTRGRGIGFGDVKFSLIIGYLLGFPSSLLAIYLAFVSGAIVAITLIALGRKKFRGGTIAFGPFLVIGVFVVLLFSEYIYSFVFRLYS